MNLMTILLINNDIYHVNCCFVTALLIKQNEKIRVSKNLLFTNIFTNNKRDLLKKLFLLILF